MDLKQLSYVIAIADEGSFTAAAEQSGITQPSLSYAVKALENELGVALFHRLGRSVRLTPAGEALIGPARRALRDADMVREAVAEVRGIQAGRLDLVCLPTLAVTPLADLVGRFRQQHPGVQVRIEEPEDTDAVAEAIRTGASELGVTELPARPYEDLLTAELDAQEFVAVLPAPEGAPRGSPASAIKLTVLAGMPLVTTPPGTSTRRQTDEAFAAAGLEPVVAVETDHREGIIEMVQAGAGAAIVPAPLAVRASGSSATVRPISPRIRRRIGLVQRPGPLSPAAQAFKAIAVPDTPARAPRPPARRRGQGVS